MPKYINKGVFRVCGVEPNDSLGDIIVFLKTSLSCVSLEIYIDIRVMHNDVIKQDYITVSLNPKLELLYIAT